jgi:hypothetical protein
MTDEIDLDPLIHMKRHRDAEDRLLALFKRIGLRHDGEAVRDAVHCALFVVGERELVNAINLYAHHEALRIEMPWDHPDPPHTDDPSGGDEPVPRLAWDVDNPDNAGPAPGAA